MTGDLGPWAPRRLPPAHLLAAFDSASLALLPRLNLSRDSDGLGPHLSLTLNLACFYRISLIQDMAEAVA